MSIAPCSIAAPHLARCFFRFRPFSIRYSCRAYVAYVHAASKFATCMNFTEAELSNQDAEVMDTAVANSSNNPG